jgi:hypothetical protein
MTECAAMECEAQTNEAARWGGLSFLICRAPMRRAPHQLKPPNAQIKRMIGSGIPTSHSNSPRPM